VRYIEVSGLERSGVVQSIANHKMTKTEEGRKEKKRDKGNERKSNKGRQGNKLRIRTKGKLENRSGALPSIDEQPL
jgi:hypothetical protein